MYVWVPRTHAFSGFYLVGNRFGIYKVTVIFTLKLLNAKLYRGHLLLKCTLKIADQGPLVYVLSIFNLFFVFAKFDVIYKIFLNVSILDPSDLLLHNDLFLHLKPFLDYFFDTVSFFIFGFSVYMFTRSENHDTFFCNLANNYYWLCATCFFLLFFAFDNIESTPLARTCQIIFGLPLA